MSRVYGVVSGRAEYFKAGDMYRNHKAVADRKTNNAICAFDQLLLDSDFPTRLYHRRLRRGRYSSKQNSYGKININANNMKVGGKVVKVRLHASGWTSMQREPPVLVNN